MLKGKWTPWRPLVVVLCSFTMVTATVPAVPLLSGPATALSTHVVPHTYPTIQAAIDARVALITIAPGTYKENLTLPNNADVTLRGDDPSTTTIDGDLKGAVIDKGRAKGLVVENLTITRGARASGAGIGGGIHSSDNALTLRNVIVTANSENAGAGVVIDKGTLVIENSVISSNTAKNNGGGVLVRAGTATITNTSFLNNRAEAPETGAGEGGALVVLAGTVTITDSTFDGNMAIRDGGAIWNDGILNVTGSTITNNATQRDGGGIYDVGVGFTITDSTVAGNTATGKGGGIYENTGSSSPASTYTRVTISGNTAGTGAGAYFANSSGSVVITESTISGNTATVDGGGGLYNSTGLTLARSTLSGNTSNTRGGGFYNIAGTVSATNSTISGNSATASGGGIFESSNNGTTLNNVTVTANTAPVGSGITVSAGKLTMANTVVAGNTGSPNNVNGTFTGTPNLTTGDPILGPLGDNGGPTLTHLPLSGSPAINAGTNATCATIDQRNVARPQGVACDLGAVEAGLADLSITMADSPDPVDAGGDLTYTLTITNNGPSPSSGSTVTDTLPAELANQQVCVVTGTVDCSNATDFVAYTGTVAVGPLASGVSASMYLRGTVDPGLDDLTLTNTATVAGAELDQAPGNNSATAETSVLAAVTTVDVTDISADLPAVGAFPSKLDIPTLKSSPEALDALRQATATSNPTDDTVEGSQISAIQISAIQISAIQISAIQISAIQISAIQISAIQISAIQISAIGSCSGVTADTDGDGTLDGEELLALTNAYGDAPTQTVTLGQLFALVESSGESDCVKDAIRALTLENIGLGSSEIGSLSLVSLAIGGLQISAIHPDPTATEAEKLADWCSALAAQGYDCATAGVTATTNLMSLDLAGVQISAIELDGTQISAIQISAIQISAIDLNGIQISAIQISAIDPVVVTDLINCNLVSCQTATLGDAWLAGAFWDDVTLGDLLQALIPSDELPWEQLPVDQVPVPVLLAASESAQTVGYTASFDVDTPGDNPKPASAVVTLEDGFRYVPGTAALGATAAEPTTDGQTLSFDLGDIPTGTYQLTFDAVPGLTLGTFGATVGVTVAEASDSLRGAPVTVLQNFEPGNNASAAVFGFDDDTLLFGHAPPSDNDFWSFSPSLVLPGADGHYTVRLAQLGVDADLLVYGPKTDPLSPFDTRGNSLQIEPLEDRGLAIGDQTDDLDPAALEDIVLSSDLLNGPWELEGLSVSRSTQDESVEFFTADPANDPLTIQVASVNHTSSATADEVSNSTYTLWVKTEFAAPVSCPVPAPTGGTPGAVYPAGMTAQDLAQLDTVFLVNRSRIERHESAADADAVMAKLADLVDALNGGDPELGALGLHAAVIAVEGDLTAAGITSTTGAAISNLYAAWDADPCDYTLANDVAFEITNIVKDLDDTNPLQFVTVVGSDSEIPMFRQRDWAKVSNEKLYKSTFAGNTALFGSSASERFLTDDGYGDRDPLPLEQQSGVLFQPDMSLGRLVETSDEIIGLIDEYLDHDGQLDRASALVTGYDFLLDGADAVVTALQAAGIVSIDTDLISDIWTADDLAAKFATPADILSVEGHYDHSRSLPAAVDATDTVGTTYDTSELPDPISQLLANNVLFSVGCHSGLSVDDEFYSTAETLDWPQAIAQQRAVYIANTGYGYGDTEGVFYSERLMELFTEQMELETGRSVADALRDAKQLYIGELQQAGVYDLKVVQEAVFYGLPMYQLGPEPAAPLTAAASAPGVGTSPWGEAPGIEALDFTINATFTQTDAADGSFLVATPAVTGGLTITDSRPLAVHYAPIQPSVSIDVTNGDPALTARGSILMPNGGTQGLRYTDIDPFEPLLSRPRIDLAANEARPNVLVKDIAFPSVFESISDFNLSRTGRQQRFNAVLGQFVWDRDESNSSGIQTQFPETSWRVLYGSSPDFEPPVALGSELFLDGGELTFLLELTDDPAPGQVDSVVFAQAIFRDAAPTTSGTASHTFVDLQRIPGTRQWTATVPTGLSQVRAYFQFCDQNGNCGFISGKGLGLVAKLLSAGQDQVVVFGDATEPINGTFDDPTGGTHTVTVDWGDGTTGTASVIDDIAGTFTIDPHTYGAVGVYTVTITVTDGVDFSAIDTLRIFVISPNAPPVANDDTATTPEDTSADINVVGNDTDPDGNLNPASMTVQTGPAHGTVVSLGSGVVRYTPDLDYNGPDSFTYQVCDFGFVTLCDSATVGVTVTPVNDPPYVANPIDDIVIDEDGTIDPIDLDGVFADVEGDGLTYQAVSSNTDVVSVSVSGSTLTLTLVSDANGSATVTVTAYDSDGNVSDEFTITVNAVNDPPVADAQAMSTNEDVAVDITLTASDVDSTDLTYAVVAGPGNGTLTGTAPNLTYTPAADFNGSDSFTFSASDGTATSAPATVSITVDPVNDAPSFVAGGDRSVLEDSGAYSVAWATGISAGPADEAGQTLAFSVSNNNTALFSVQPAIAPDGTLTFTPAANANGSALVTVTLSDNGGTANDGVDTSGPVTFTVTVVAVNDAPSFTAGPNTSVAEDSGSYSAAWASILSAGPADEAGQTLSFAVSNNNTALFSVQPAIAPDGTLTFTPALNANGSAQVTVTLSDTGGTFGGGVDTSGPVTFTITVTPVTDAVLRYVGVTQLQTGGTVPLRVTVTSTDGGSVVGGTVSFFVGTSTVPVCTDEVVLLYPGAPATAGTAFCNQSFSVTGGGAEATFAVNATLTGPTWSGGLDPVASQRCPEGSANPAGTCNVRVFKGVQHTITGGGNLLLSNSAGEYPANLGSKKNYGFNADSGKKGNNLKGDINIVYEYKLPNGTVTNYQLKAMSVASVGKSGILGEISAASATLTDLTTSAVVASGLVLQVRVTDGDDDSDPLTVDTVSYTAWDPNDGHLVFATNWDPALNIARKQTLDGGNIDIK